jgi:hypothetical protein
MKRLMPGRIEDPDFESTDTLPMPVLQDTDVRAIPAIPVGPSDLAASLRESEQSLELSAHRVAELEAGLEAAGQRCAELQRECDALRAQATPQETAIEPALAARWQKELAELRRQNERLHEALGTVQGQLAVREAMLADAELALRDAVAAPPAVPAPDSGEWRVRCAELNAALEAERAAALERGQAQEARLAALEVELDAVRVRLQVPSETAAHELPHWAAQPRPLGSALRVLVREDGDTQVVYPLGRHTTIGRTPDNDIQVNATYVSRNHAVLLAGTDHCIIEDLNSTNGLLVNGHPVGRQVLHDGDTVTIGKTHFRYQQRE